MFRKTSSKYSVYHSSKESLNSSGTQSSSTENLSSPREHVFENNTSLCRDNPNQSLSELHYLGMIQDVNLGGGQTEDSTADVQLIDKLEEAQLEGKIQLVPKDEDLVTVTISKHGVKVLDTKKKEVLQRHPLHTVAQIVYYTDSFYKSNIALKIGQVGRTVYDCYVFQCFSEDQAQKICQSVKDVFEMISSFTT